ncbi:alanine/ornithine racemase family PLP-dependent enzyme [Salimicrobium flavidum]|uniref:Predicted amino acid racemase n=1 Tax=Salimicrobium flavidum TaxID=570947 RepID=A0A1N7KTY3_9BACI|nr:alanine/ornithine racemase family PLP-dependent enzyme [Salimicrobium flavidum]SIS65073.1 Predicted amino acid racemase [Salimicrobium flavidum]
MKSSATPRIEINLAKIAHNASTLVGIYGAKNIGLMGVTKTVCGAPEIARVLLEQGIPMLADSKLANLKRMREAGIKANFVYLRSPALSEIDLVIKYADISINTELAVVTKLSEAAVANNMVQNIIVMVEMGDLREGVMPDDLDCFIKETLTLKGIEIVGIGVNFACFGGVKPDNQKMDYLSLLASMIETKFTLPLSIVSGGNSANYEWFMGAENVGKVNNLRLGESIYLGRETLNRKAIPELYTDAFTLVAEVIESKVKPSMPYGERGQNAFGEVPEFQDRGLMNRVIVGVGNQDVLVAGLIPLLDIEILGSSSDHTVMNAKDSNLKVGDEVTFNLNYGALLTLMTSPFVHKKYNYAINDMLTPEPF